MNQIAALLLAAGLLWLTGCVSVQKTAPTISDTVPATWEYKVVHPPHMMGDWPIMDFTNSYYPNGMDAGVQDFLDQLGKDGWIFVCRHGLTFYFKRLTCYSGATKVH